MWPTTKTRRHEGDSAAAQRCRYRAPLRVFVPFCGYLSNCPNRAADHVLVINDGEIVTEGTHQELLAKRGFFYRLYTSQFKGHRYRPVSGGHGYGTVWRLFPIPYGCTG